MKNLAPPARKATKGLVSIFLISAVGALCLLTLSGGTRSWSASEPMGANKQLNLPLNMKIVYKEGLLNVSLKKADFVKVLKEIARKSNVEIIFNGSIKEKVTLEFVNLPLEKGLKRLLKNQNYFFTYSEKTGTDDKESRYFLSRVVLIGKSGTSPEEGGQRVALMEDSRPSPPVKEMRLDERPTGMINELLSQDPQKQKKALEALSETVKDSLIQIRPQLEEALEELGQQGKIDFGLEEIETLLKGLELGNSNAASPGRAALMEGAQQGPPPKEMRLDEIPAGLIDELLSQDPQKQEKALEALSETLKDRIPQTKP